MGHPPHGASWVGVPRGWNRGALEFWGTQPGAMLGNSAMMHALRTSEIAASGRGFRSSFKDWAHHEGVDELPSEFALAHVEGSKTVAAYVRDDLMEKRHPVMQAWSDFVAPDTSPWREPSGEV